MQASTCILTEQCSLSVRVLQRRITIETCLHVYGEKELKELVHVIAGAGKCEIQRPAGWKFRQALVRWGHLRDCGHMTPGTGSGISVTLELVEG